jgi:hypothetical protein
MTATAAKRPSLIRWANVAVRGAHLITIVGLGAALLGAPVSAATYGMAVVASGAVLLALELADKPSTLFEASGVSLLFKLFLVAWMALDRQAPLALFWIVIAWSAFFAHAPSAFRHARLLRKDAS